MAAPLAPQRDPERGLVSDLLFYLVAEGDAGHCAKSFDRLAAWVDTSLDMYRVRLPGPGTPLQLGRTPRYTPAAGKAPSVHPCSRERPLGTPLQLGKTACLSFSR